VGQIACATHEDQQTIRVGVMSRSSALPVSLNMFIMMIAMFGGENREGALRETIKGVWLTMASQLDG
jgi:hypothetical protein